jgi:hypothetical protein
MDTPQARALLLAITLQEDPQQLRAQRVIVAGKPRKGPARGLWQFELGGGVRGVMTHAASRYWAQAVCKARGVDFTARAVWNALETDDLLAGAFARLLIFTDAQALPALDDVQGAWRLYRFRCWRPGKPHPDKWPGNHAQALEVVRG